MTTQRLFRILTVICAAVHLLLWASPYLTRRWLIHYDVWLLDFDGYGALITYDPVLYWCLLASWMLVLAGLYFYIATARPVFAMLVAVSIALSTVWGVRVLTPHESALVILASLIDGALIAMAYLSPVRTEFVRVR